MTQRKVAKELSEEGRRALAHFLADNLRDKTLRSLISAWEDDVTFDINDCQEGYIEVGMFHSKTGNPVTTNFCDDEVIFEDVEEDED